MAGRFIIKKTPKGFYRFSLLASNARTILTSQNYTTMQNCRKGIESIINHADAPVDDLTLKRPEPKKYPKYEIYRDTEERFRYRLMASNGQNIAIAEEGYASKAGCLNGISAIMKDTQEAEVIVES